MTEALYWTPLTRVGEGEYENEYEYRHKYRHTYTCRHTLDTKSPDWPGRLGCLVTGARCEPRCEYEYGVLCARTAILLCRCHSLRLYEHSTCSARRHDQMTARLLCSSLTKTRSHEGPEGVTLRPQLNTCKAMSGLLQLLTTHRLLLALGRCCAGALRATMVLVIE